MSHLNIHKPLPHDDEIQLLMWLRIHKGQADYLSALHSSSTASRCEKNGWVKITSKRGSFYRIELTDEGRAILEHSRPSS